jgi:hypothetical protein
MAGEFDADAAVESGRLTAVPVVVTRSFTAMLF